MAAAYQAIAERKQAQREALIPTDWRLSTLPPGDVLNVMDIPAKSGILSANEIEITERYDATALAEAIRSKVLTSVQVTMAFCKRAAIAQQLTNCLTEILFEPALRRAAFLDNHLARYGTTVGPFHGVPISIKDSFKFAGTDASIGIAALCFKPAEESAHLVNVLLSAGAVIYCKTNIPQTLGTLDSTNNVFGRVLNPLNRLCTAGGSTGGEGALIAMRGSPLGVGTDIGGSIRVPAMCNGIYGIKPSANRVPYSGQEGGGPAGSQQLGLIASAGPLARSMRDCELFLKVVADAKPWMTDPALIPGMWDSSSLDIRTRLSSADQSEEILTVGVLHSDNLVTPLPPIQQLLAELSTTLSKAQHPEVKIRVVQLPTPSILSKAQDLANRLMGVHGNDPMMDSIESTGEPLIPWLVKMKSRRRPAVSYPKLRDLYAQAETMNGMLAKELWKVPAGQLGQGEDIDAIICPVAPHPTPKIDDWWGVGYTANWVLMDYPGGVIPVREFKEKDLESEISEEAWKYPKSWWHAETQKLWGKSREDRTQYLGTVMAVQVLAPRLQERKLCRAMTVIDEVVRQAGERIDAKL